VTLYFVVQPTRVVVDEVHLFKGRGTVIWTAIQTMPTFSRKEALTSPSRKVKALHNNLLYIGKGMLEAFINIPLYTWSFAE
jgi:hypothetical protein